jgi:uncharacterized caspase-like protein
MRDAIREFGREINQGGVGLFYYSGHGLQVDGVRQAWPQKLTESMYSTEA